uniref:NADH dehydrogenase subunit 2 n=1 Tax=Medakamo hakoo TaxID=3113649 RepID=A0A8D5TC98_9CHLO|nr:NADH dehydrogenase subunit 2 [Medakamo hakoo]
MNSNVSWFNLQPLNDFSFSTLFFENDFKVILPELFLVSCTLGLIVYGVVLSTSKEHNYPLLVPQMIWMTQLSLAWTIILYITSPWTNCAVLSQSFLVDYGTTFFKIIILLATMVTLFLSQDFLSRQFMNSFEFPILFLLSSLGMVCFISAGDLLALYLTLEFHSLCFYVLAAFRRDSEFSTEAGLKYFILGAFSSGLLLFGCSLIYGFTGTLEFDALAQLLQGGDSSLYILEWRGCELGLLFLMVGFLFKLTAVPFHMWAPDVYEGAPLPVTAFFSIAPKASFFFLFTRVLYQSFYDFLPDWQAFLFFCSAASMILACFAGLTQSRIKRLLAYSSIGHSGYLLIGLCCGTLEGIQALVIYLVVYIITTAVLFGILLIPVHRQGFQEVERFKYTTDFARLGKTNPLLALTCTVALFSIAGIPPLAGFYAKAAVFWTAMNVSQYSLAIIGILTSAVSCFYYIRVVKIMYFETPKTWVTLSQPSQAAAYCLAISFLFLVFLMVYPTPLYLVSHKVACALVL